MKFFQKLKVWLLRLKSYFVGDQSKNYLINIEDFFPSEKIFQLFGYIFLSELCNSKHQTIQRRRKIVFWISLAIFIADTSLLAGNLIYIIAGSHLSERFFEAVESYAWMLGFALIVVKLFLLCNWKRIAIKKLVERLDKHFPHSNSEQLQFGVGKHLRQLKILTRACFFVCVWTWLHMTYMPFVLMFNESKIELLHPIYLPWDPLQSFLYPIFYVQQSAYTLYAALTETITNLVFCSLVSVTAMELDVLAQQLALIDPESDENAEKKLQDIIDGYNELIEIANELEGIFSPLLLANVCGEIFLLCSCIFIVFSPIKLHLMMKYSVTVPFVVVQFFCICFYGERLQTASMRVADEAYNSNWYGKNLKFRKMILLTMIRAQKPHKLTGMKFMHIGLPVFEWIMKTAHSYYSVLNGFYRS